MTEIMLLSSLYLRMGGAGCAGEDGEAFNGKTINERASE